MTEHRPTLAAAITGLTASLIAWGIGALSPYVPPEVTAALAILATIIATIIGGYAGQIAERFTTPWKAADDQDGHDALDAEAAA